MEVINQAPTDIQVAVIAGSVALTVSLISSLIQLALWFFDKKVQRESELMSFRRDALLDALKVIDHVYSNSEFDGRKAYNPHKWDISLANEALNKILVFCKEPEKTVHLFKKATGIHDPLTESAPSYGTRELHDFRKQVCKELDAPGNYDISTSLWVAELPGSQIGSP